ncbi:hypothetical protein ABIC60_003644 [Phyllobacterium ifriqiyense]
MIGHRCAALGAVVMTPRPWQTESGQKLTAMRLLSPQTVGRFPHCDDTLYRHPGPRSFQVSVAFCSCLLFANTGHRFLAPEWTFRRRSGTGRHVGAVDCVKTKRTILQSGGPSDTKRPDVMSSRAIDLRHLRWLIPSQQHVLCARIGRTDLRVPAKNTSQSWAALRCLSSARLPFAQKPPVENIQETPGLPDELPVFWRPNILHT